MAHEWPGNVRELENVIERVVLLSRDEEADVSDLPNVIGAPASSNFSFVGPVLPMRDLQRRYAAYVFEKLGATKTQTAEVLDIDVKTLAKLLSAEPQPDE